MAKNKKSAWILIVIAVLVLFIGIAATIYTGTPTFQPVTPSGNAVAEDTIGYGEVSVFVVNGDDQG